MRLLYTPTDITGIPVQVHVVMLRKASWLADCFRAPDSQEAVGVTLQTLRRSLA